MLGRLRRRNGGRRLRVGVGGLPLRVRRLSQRAFHFLLRRRWGCSALRRGWLGRGRHPFGLHRVLRRIGSGRTSRRRRRPVHSHHHPWKLVRRIWRRMLVLSLLCRRWRRLNQIGGVRLGEHCNAWSREMQVPSPSFRHARIPNQNGCAWVADR